MKKIGKILLSFLLLICMSTSLVACGGASTFVNPGDSLGGGGTGESATSIDVSEQETATENAATTDLSDLAEDTDSSGASNVETTTEPLDIDSSGSYYLSGEYSSGVKISAAKGSDIHLYLNNATITNSNGKALYSENKVSVIITLVSETTNTITNAGDDVNAVHIKGDLSINGSGKLVVTSGSKSGIKASQTLQIVDSEIDVTAQGHGLTAETIIAKDCKISVTTGKDGMQAESSAYQTKDSNGNYTYAYTLEDGYISLTDVEYTAQTQGDGIQADTFVYINGGTYDITTTGTWVVYSTTNIETYGLETDDFRWTSSGSSYKKIASDEVSRYSTTSLYALAQGCKGIKVGELEYEDASGNTQTVSGDYNILIKGGTFSIDSSDDAIHTNSGDTIIKDGTFTISTKDDGITSDNLTQIDGGKITITTSYEGIEGAYVEISGGEIDVYATDDGINAASDDSSVAEHIIITGGTIVVKSDGDGIDSNGNIQIEGGIVIVHGPTSGADASLDADKGILVNGGYLFATGSLGMVETPSANSSQYVVSLATQSAISANTTIALKDSSGNTLMSVTTLKSCQSIIMSCPELEQNATYTIYGGSSTLGSFTVSSTISSIGSTSNGTPGQNPGSNPGGPGGGFGGRR